MYLKTRYNGPVDLVIRRRILIAFGSGSAGRSGLSLVKFPDFSFPCELHEGRTGNARHP